jgi:hypothetical protein
MECMEAKREGLTEIRHRRAPAFCVPHRTRPRRYSLPFQPYALITQKGSGRGDRIAISSELTFVVMGFSALLYSDGGRRRRGEDGTAACILKSVISILAICNDGWGAGPGPAIPRKFQRATQRVYLNSIRKPPKRTGFIVKSGLPASDQHHLCLGHRRSTAVSAPIPKATGEGADCDRRLERCEPRAPEERLGGPFFQPQ